MSRVARVVSSSPSLSAERALPRVVDDDGRFAGSIAAAVQRALAAMLPQPVGTPPPIGLGWSAHTSDAEGADGVETAPEDGAEVREDTGTHRRATSDATSTLGQPSGRRGTLVGYGSVESYASVSSCATIPSPPSETGFVTGEAHEPREARETDESDAEHEAGDDARPELGLALLDPLACGLRPASARAFGGPEAPRETAARPPHAPPVPQAVFPRELVSAIAPDHTPPTTRTPREPDSLLPDAATTAARGARSLFEGIHESPGGPETLAARVLDLCATASIAPVLHSAPHAHDDAREPAPKQHEATRSAAVEPGRARVTPPRRDERTAPEPVHHVEHTTRGRGHELAPSEPTRAPAHTATTGAVSHAAPVVVRPIAVVSRPAPGANTSLDPAPPSPEPMPESAVRYTHLETDHARVEITHPVLGALECEVRQEQGVLDVSVLTRSIGASIALRGAEQDLRAELRTKTTELRSYRVRTEARGASRARAREDEEDES